MLKRRKPVSASILVALKDSVTSRAVLDYIADMPFNRDDVRFTLLHLFRKPSESESLVGEDFVEKAYPRALEFLNRARDKLTEKGFNPETIQVKLVTEPYPTISDGIIDQCVSGECHMVVIGRKRMSKAEEFVMGDISIKLVRAMRNKGILVVESQ
jgi:nucleotide-binding universal stress UspA family protein